MSGERGSVSAERAPARIGSVLLRLLRAAVIAYVVYAGALWVLQRQLLFPHSGLMQAPALLDSLPGAERWLLSGPDGDVEALFLPGPAPAAPVVLLAHGNAELIDTTAPFFVHVAELGCALLAVEYPGYGRSAGSPSQASIAAVFDVAYDRLIARPEVDPDKVLLFGRSLGSGVVADLSLRRPSAALVLQSPFTHVGAFAADMLLPPFLVRDPFDNRAAVAAYAGPVLVIHGEEDDIVPVQHGRTLAALAAHGRLELHAAGHNDLPRDPRRYWNDLRRFLQQAGLTR